MQVTHLDHLSFLGAGTNTYYCTILRQYHDVGTPGVPTYSGHIGLKGDTQEKPKRSFFWYFPAEHDANNAPVILTVGGGPGTSGLINPVFGQSPCTMTKDGLVRNPEKSEWSEHYNLVGLDHPVGAGYSYGSRVNNSRDAAYDVYDFLQKFFSIFPELSRNQFYVSGGSYGGIYVPHIATVIHEQNQRHTGAININLEALLVSNPFSDPASHYKWQLYYMCTLTDVYNSTTCADLHAVLPSCLESIEMSMLSPTLDNKLASLKVCIAIKEGDTHGRVIEDVRRVVHDPLSCHSEFTWATKFFNSSTTKALLGVPDYVNYTSFSGDVSNDFIGNADIWHRHYLLYEPLLQSGIRALHWIGARDANCPWPGVLSFLKLLRTPFQQEFLAALDLSWSDGEATVRAIGAGAGNMTYILLAEAGHFVVKDQPALAKKIVEGWIENKPWFD
ncbi:alpha/beta-hydrolase [Desarmillaria tabescens]|uniref:Alpha/beta-hydrolase n=1 Tax=Armillaria tabescens TaxID=1929756 RepID=A0AA39N637_ARMTA|nr:alpha/beta-hydrolase [Desarmillaria tabescens]KAK0459272.1 alpha/beta-hydrolase [Desarmillaria tabescens]